MVFARCLIVADGAKIPLQGRHVVVPVDRHGQRIADEHAPQHAPQPFVIVWFPHDTHLAAGYSGRTLPGRQFRDRVLELPSRFANDEFHVLRCIQHDEMWTQQIAEGIQRHVGLAAFAEAAQPVLLLREFLQPGVGRCNDENAPKIQPLVNGLQKPLGVVEPIDQIGGQDQIVTGELRLEIRRVALEELHSVCHAVQSHFGQASFVVRNDIAFLDEFEMNIPLFLELQRHADESGREIDARYEIELLGQFERCPPHGAAQVQGLASRTPLRVLETSRRTLRGEIGNIEIGLAVMGFAVLRNGGIRLVHRFRHRERLLRLHVTQPRVLKEMSPKRVAAVAGRLVAGRNPRSAFDQVVLRIESRGRKIIVVRMDLKPVEARNRRFRPLPDVADDVEELPESRNDSPGKTRPSVPD